MPDFGPLGSPWARPALIDMTLQNINARLAAALLAVTACLPTQAAIHASGSISNFVVELTDDSPGDAVAPSLTWLNTRSLVQGVSFAGPGYAEDGQAFGNTPFGSLSRDYGAGPVSSSVSTSGSTAPDPQDAILRVSGSIDDAPALPVPADTIRYFSVAASSNADFYDTYSLILSPFTSLLINATASLSLQKTSAAGTSRLDAELAVGQASLYLVGPRFDNGDSMALYIDPWDDARTVSRTGVISARFTNETSEPVMLRFAAQIGLDGSSPVAVVPEPGTGALLLSGMGLLALWRRRSGPPCP